MSPIYYDLRGKDFLEIHLQYNPNYLPTWIRISNRTNKVFQAINDPKNLTNTTTTTISTIKYEIK